MRALDVDAWLPDSLISESVDVRRRARLVFFAVGISVLVIVAVAILMPSVNWTGNPYAWACLHVAMHLPTLLILRWTRSLSAAANYFLAVVFLQSALEIFPSNGLSLFGFIAVPVAAAHLLGNRASVGWTIASVVATLSIPALFGAEPRIFQIGAATATITLAIGIASSIVESSRARAVREMEAAESSVRLHRERLRAVVEQTFPCIAETCNDEVVFVSESVRDLVGYTPEEIRSVGAQLVRTEDVTMIRRRLLQNPSSRSRAEIRVRDREGRWLWLEVFAIPYGETPADARWLFAARGIDDEIQHRERVEQAQRLEGIGSLAAGIAHDFNNLLTVISGFGAQLAPSEAREQILGASYSAAELTAQLLAFGRSGPLVDELIDPIREIESLTPVIRSLLGEEVDLAIRGSAGGATSRIAPGRFKQVVLNLVTNAKEAMPAGGRVELGLQRAIVEGERAEALGLSPGPFIQIAIRDTGTGMSEEVRRRAFDPFFTTKGPQRGSGLGLASAYGIVRRCHGTIELESQPGAGTVARVLLPDAQEALPVAAPAQASTAASVAASTVWIVEDDPRIQRLMRSALEGAGYRTVVAADGPAALALLAREATPRLLITDVVMPGMRGTELAARLRDQEPGLRVLYISGYSEGEIGDFRSGEQGVHFLSKPFRPAELISAVGALAAG